MDSKRIDYPSEQYDAFFESSPDCVKILDVDGNLRAMNRNGLCSMEIDDFSAVCGELWPSLWPQDSQHDIQQALATARNGSIGRFEAFCPTVKGTPKWWDVVVAPMLAGDGKLAGLLSISRDVTHIRQAEALQRETDARLRFALDVTRFGEWEVDLERPDGNYSRRYFQCFGYAEAVPGWDWPALLRHVWPDDRAAVSAAWYRAVADKGTLRFECRVRWPDQSVHWISMHGSYNHALPARARMTGLISDVTERMQITHELQQANQKKDEFLAMLAHELRNPLAPISTAAHLLSMTGVKPEQVLKAGKIIERQAAHMNGLLDDLLDVARVTQGLVVLVKTAVSVDTVLADAVDQVAPLIMARQHHLILPPAPTSAIVWGDTKRLVQIVVNLLNNAAKYTASGGTIELSMQQTDSTITLTVRDNGIGMAPATLASAFDLFAQASSTPDRSTGGLGLGLALVQSLVGQHGGSVQAVSAGLGCGSEFLLTLPLHALPLPLAAVATMDTGAGETGALRRLLVVDDNVDAGETLSLYLAGCGFDVQTCVNGRDAIELARHWRPDGFLLDLGLPEMSGYDLARRLRALPGMARVVMIAVSGYGSAAHKQEASEAGFDRHLTKPVDLAVLNELLTQLIPAAQ